MLGFGLGGTLAYLASAQSGCNVAIGYCGIGIDTHLDLVFSVKAHLSLYFAEEDELVNQDAQTQIREALKPVETAQVFVHPYVRHGFARWDSKQRDRCALTLAEHRAGEFFYMNLKLKHWVQSNVRWTPALRIPASR